MPELPEVESTIRRLSKEVLNKRVTSAHIGWKNMLPLSTPRKFSNDICGAKFGKPFRRGKYLVFPLTKEKKRLTLILHQKMSGRTKVFDRSQKRSQYDHVVVGLSN